MADEARHNLTITVGGCRTSQYHADCSCGWRAAGNTNTDASLLFGRHLVEVAARDGATR